MESKVAFVLQIVLVMTTLGIHCKKSIHHGVVTRTTINRLKQSQEMMKRHLLPSLQPHDNATKKNDVKFQQQQQQNRAGITFKSDTNDNINTPSKNNIPLNPSQVSNGNVKKDKQSRVTSTSNTATAPAITHSQTYTTKTAAKVKTAKANIKLRHHRPTKKRKISVNKGRKKQLTNGDKKSQHTTDLKTTVKQQQHKLADQHVGELLKQIQQRLSFIDRLQAKLKRTAKINKMKKRRRRKPKIHHKTQLDSSKLTTSESKDGIEQNHNLTLPSKNQKLMVLISKNGNMVSLKRFNRLKNKGLVKGITPVYVKDNKGQIVFAIPIAMKTNDHRYILSRKLIMIRRDKVNDFLKSFHVNVGKTAGVHDNNNKSSDAISTHRSSIKAGGKNPSLKNSHKNSRQLNNDRHKISHPNSVIKKYMIQPKDGDKNDDIDEFSSGNDENITAIHDDDNDGETDINDGAEESQDDVPSWMSDVTTKATSIGDDSEDDDTEKSVSMNQKKMGGNSGNDSENSETKTDMEITDNTVDNKTEQRLMEQKNTIENNLRALENISMIPNEDLEQQERDEETNINKSSSEDHEDISEYGSGSGKEVDEKKSNTIESQSDLEKSKLNEGIEQEAETNNLIADNENLFRDHNETTNVVEKDQREEEIGKALEGSGTKEESTPINDDDDGVESYENSRQNTSNLNQSKAKTLTENPHTSRLRNHHHHFRHHRAKTRISSTAGVSHRPKYYAERNPLLHPFNPTKWKIKHAEQNDSVINDESIDDEEADEDRNTNAYDQLEYPNPRVYGKPFEGKYLKKQPSSEPPKIDNKNQTKNAYPWSLQQSSKTGITSWMNEKNISEAQPKLQYPDPNVYGKLFKGKQLLSNKNPHPSSNNIDQWSAFQQQTYQQYTQLNINQPSLDAKTEISNTPTLSVSQYLQPNQTTSTLPQTYQYPSVSTTYQYPMGNYFPSTTSSSSNSYYRSIPISSQPSAYNQQQYLAPRPQLSIQQGYFPSNQNQQQQSTLSSAQADLSGRDNLEKQKQQFPSSSYYMPQQNQQQQQQQSAYQSNVASSGGYDTTPYIQYAALPGTDSSSSYQQQYGEYYTSPSKATEKHRKLNYPVPLIQLQHIKTKNEEGKKENITATVGQEKFTQNNSSLVQTESKNMGKALNTSKSLNTSKLDEPPQYQYNREVGDVILTIDETKDTATAESPKKHQNPRPPTNTSLKPVLTSKYFQDNGISDFNSHTKALSFLKSFYKHVSQITHDPTFWKRISSANKSQTSTGSTKRDIVLGPILDEIEKSDAKNGVPGAGIEFLIGRVFDDDDDDDNDGNRNYDDDSIGDYDGNNIGNSKKDKEMTGSVRNRLVVPNEIQDEDDFHVQAGGLGGIITILQKGEETAITDTPLVESDVPMNFNAEVKSSVHHVKLDLSSQPGTRRNNNNNNNIKKLLPLSHLTPPVNGQPLIAEDFQIPGIQSNTLHHITTPVINENPNKFSDIPGSMEQRSNFNENNFPANTGDVLIGRAIGVPEVNENEYEKKSFMFETFPTFPTFPSGKSTENTEGTAPLNGNININGINHQLSTSGDFLQSFSNPVNSIIDEQSDDTEDINNPDFGGSKSSIGGQLTPSINQQYPDTIPETEPLRLPTMPVQPIIPVISNEDRQSQMTSPLKRFPTPGVEIQMLPQQQQPIQQLYQEQYPMTTSLADNHDDTLNKDEIKSLQYNGLIPLKDLKTENKKFNQFLPSASPEDTPYGFEDPDGVDSSDKGEYKDTNIHFKSNDTTIANSDAEKLLEDEGFVQNEKGNTTFSKVEDENASRQDINNITSHVADSRNNTNYNSNENSAQNTSTTNSTAKMEDKVINTAALAEENGISRENVTTKSVANLNPEPSAGVKEGVNNKDLVINDTTSATNTTIDHSTLKQKSNNTSTVQKETQLLDETEAASMNHSSTRKHEMKNNTSATSEIESQKVQEETSDGKSPEKNLSLPTKQGKSNSSTTHMESKKVSGETISETIETTPNNEEIEKTLNSKNRSAISIDENIDKNMEGVIKNITSQDLNIYYSSLRRENELRRQRQRETAKRKSDLVQKENSVKYSHKKQKHFHKVDFQPFSGNENDEQQKAKDILYSANDNWDDSDDDFGIKSNTADDVAMEQSTLNSNDDDDIVILNGDSKYKLSAKSFEGSGNSKFIESNNNELNVRISLNNDDNSNKSDNKEGSVKNDVLRNSHVHNKIPLFLNETDFYQNHHKATKSDTVKMIPRKVSLIVDSGTDNNDGKTQTTSEKHKENENASRSDVTVTNNKESRSQEFHLMTPTTKHSDITSDENYSSAKSNKEDINKITTKMDVTEKNKFADKLLQKKVELLRLLNDLSGKKVQEIVSRFSEYKEKIKNISSDTTELEKAVDNQLSHHFDNSTQEAAVGMPLLQNDSSDVKIDISKDNIKNTSEISAKNATEPSPVNNKLKNPVSSTTTLNTKIDNDVKEITSAHHDQTSKDPFSEIGVGDSHGFTSDTNGNVAETISSDETPMNGRRK